MFSGRFFRCYLSKKTNWNAITKWKLAETKLFNMAVSGDWSQLQVAINGTAVFLHFRSWLQKEGVAYRVLGFLKPWLYLLLGSDRVMVRVDIHVSPFVLWLIHLLLTTHAPQAVDFKEVWLLGCRVSSCPSIIKSHNQSFMSAYFFFVNCKTFAK